MSRPIQMNFTRADGQTQLLTAVPGQSIVVGRDLGCDVRLDGRKVSRRHFRLDYRADGNAVLVDNGSHNGTYVNQQRIVEVVLTLGDHVAAGEWEATVQFKDLPVVRAPVSAGAVAAAPTSDGGVRRPSAPGTMPAVGIPSLAFPEGAVQPEAGSRPLPPGARTTSGNDLPRFGGAMTHLSLPHQGGQQGPQGVGPQPAGGRPAGAAGHGHDTETGFEGPTDPSVRSLQVEAPRMNDNASGPFATSPLDSTRIVDMRQVWKWQEDEVKETPPSAESLRVARVEDNPIVRRLTETGGQLDFRGLSDLPQLEKLGRTLGPGQPQNIDSLLLRLVFKVTEALQNAESMDAFLVEMADSLCNAARAKAVVVLLPAADGSGLEPRVVKNRRAEEKVQISKTVVEHAIQNRAALATEDASADERFARGESVLRFDLKAVLVVPLMKGEDCLGAVYLTRDLPFSNTERDLVAALAQLIAMGLERSRLKEQVLHAERQKRTLERFHAPDVVKRLMMESHAPVSARGDGLFLEPLTATVIFCDLSGFTTFCEAHDAEAVGKLLNAYLGAMTEIVFAHGGTVDKYIGDAIMCIFGAPFMAQDDALRAVRCSIEMRRMFRQMVLRGDVGSMEPGTTGYGLEVHIGVNTGKVVAGTVGSPLRMEYTALGDTVNTASRLEGLAKAGQILIGPITASLVQDRIKVVSLGPSTLKGKNASIEVFEVPDIGPDVTGV